MRKSFDDNFILIHKSRPPLRWVANWAGSVGSYGLLEISYMEDEGQTESFKYKYYGWLWDTFWPLYDKYGSYYKVESFNDYE